MAGTIVDLVFNAVKGLINSLKALLNDPWDVPFVSELYKLVSGGHDLTAGDLFALIVAIPATIVYKIVRNQAPFPNDASVAEFRTDFRNLLQLSGLKARSRSSIPAVQLSAESRQGLSAFFGAVYLGSFFFYAPIEGILDAWPSESDPPEVVSQAAIALEWISWVFSCPWALDPDNNAGLNCQGTGSEFGNMVWLLGWLTPYLDTACYVFGRTEKHPEILRNLNTGTLIVDWLMAGIGFSLVVVQQVKGTFKKPTDSAQAFMGAIPGLFKFLRLPPLLAKGGGLVLAVLDVIGDEAVAIIQLASMSPGRQLEAKAARSIPA